MERECSKCGTPIGDLEQGSDEEEAAYAAELCLFDYQWKLEDEKA